MTIDLGKYAVNIKRIDPTHTLRIRRAYDKELERRFRKLEAQLVEMIVEADALKLTHELRTNAPYQPSADAVQRFMAWLKRAQARDILGVEIGTSQRGASQSWQNLYLRATYQSAMQRAAGRLRGKGARIEDTWISGAFNRPIHADRAGLIFTRSYEYLQGINEQNASRISGILTQGMVEGAAAREIAKRVVEVTKMSLKRAQTLARTEVIAAHAEATLNAYEEADAQGVEIEAEFTTAGDNKVCPKCAGLEGKIIKVKDARSPQYRIPRHPNCRCAWNPIVRNPQGIILR